VLGCYDILEELNLTMAAQQLEMKEVLPATDTEALILNCLSPEPTHIDEVGLKCGLPISTVSSTLAMMELKGAVAGRRHELYPRPGDERGISNPGGVGLR